MANCMALLVAGSNFERLFSVGTLVVPLRTIKDLVTRLHTAVTMVNTNILMACLRECLAGCCHVT
jgi:hypothetical protein